MTMPAVEDFGTEHDPTNSSDDATSTGCRKGVPWSASEHTAFLKGLQNLGKGNWRGISRMFVPSRSPTQVASHAQKYFLRLNGCTKRRSRFSGLEQGAMRPASPARMKVSSPAAELGAKAAVPSIPSPTSSSDNQPFLPAAAPAPPPAHTMMPMPFMFPPMMFTIPGNPTPFIHPMFYQAPMPPAAFGKGQGVMLPMLLPGCPAPELLSKPPMGSAALKQEGSDDSATVIAAMAGAAIKPSGLEPCRPSARRSSDQLRTTELLSHLCVTANCQVALHASEHSAFRPAGRQLTAV